MNNPLAMAQQYMQQVMNNKKMIESNPMAMNAMNMLNNGDSEGLEKLYRNMCKERNINADEMLNRARQSLGMK